MWGSQLRLSSIMTPRNLVCWTCLFILPLMYTHHSVWHLALKRNSGRHSQPQRNSEGLSQPAKGHFKAPPSQLGSVWFKFPSGIMPNFLSWPLEARGRGLPRWQMNFLHLPAGNPLLVLFYQSGISLPSKGPMKRHSQPLRDSEGLSQPAKGHFHGAS